MAWCATPPARYTTKPAHEEAGVQQPVARVPAGLGERGGKRLGRPGVADLPWLAGQAPAQPEDERDDAGEHE